MQSIRIEQAVKEMRSRGFDAYMTDDDTLIHLFLPMKYMNQKYYDKISRTLNEIGWHKSWGCTGRGLPR